MIDAHDPIEVSAVFMRGRLRPASFMWNRRHYRVVGITGMYEYYVGTYRCYGYTVRSGANLYEISLNTGDMTWRLEKIHEEG